MGYLVVTFFRRKYRLSEAVRLFFSYTKFLGSSVIEKVDGEWTVSSSLLAFNFFVSLISSLALYIVFSQNDNFFEYAYVFESLIFFEYVLLFSSRIVNLFFQVVNIDQIRLFMKSFDSLEETFLRIGSKQSVFDGPPVCRFMGNVVIILVYLPFVFSRIKFNLLSLAKLFQLFYLPFVMNMDIYTICVLIYSVQVNLSYLNSCLESLMSKDCKDGKLHDAVVEGCCKAYNEICSQKTSSVLQVDRLNTVYGLQLLVVFLNVFTMLVDILYHLIFLRSTDMISVNFGQVIVLLLCLTYIIFMTFSIATVCDRTVVKAREFNTLLFQVMISDKTSLVSKNKKIRLHISMKREIVFTAYGFFSVDYTLVHSIAAAVTTYLVILIQFADPASL